MTFKVIGGPADGLENRPASANNFAKLDFQQTPDGERWLVVRLCGGDVQYLYQAVSAPGCRRYEFLGACPPVECKGK